MYVSQELRGEIPGDVGTELTLLWTQAHARQFERCLRLERIPQAEGRGLVADASSKHAGILAESVERVCPR